MDIVQVKSRRVARTAADPMDGGMVNLWQLGRWLVSRGHRCEVVTRMPFPDEPRGAARSGEEPYTELVELPVTPSRRDDLLMRDWEEAEQFGRAMTRWWRQRPRGGSVVHSHHWSSVAGIDAWLPDDVPLVHTPHLLAVDKAQTLQRALPPEIAAVERAVMHRADVVIALSPAEGQTIRRVYGIAPSRIATAPNTVDLDAAGRSAYAPAGLPGRQLRLVSVGRIAVQKGFDLAVDCVRRLLAAGVDVVLDLIGPSYDEPDYEAALRRQVAALGGNAWRVRLVGGLPHAETVRRIAEADLSVQLSRFESQGIAILEAVACRTPVVAVGHDAVRECIVDGRDGLLLDRPSAELAAAAVRRFLSDRALRGRLAGPLVRDHSHPMAQQVAAIYGRLGKEDSVA